MTDRPPNPNLRNYMKIVSGLYSAREAARILGCSLPTIQGYISRRVLTPHELAPHRSPRGSRLDFADLVLLASYLDLAAGGVQLTMETSYTALEMGVRWTFDGVPNMICQRVTQAPRERMMQAFIEAFDYDAYIVALSFSTAEMARSWLVLPIRSEGLAEVLNDYLRRQGDQSPRGLICLASTKLHHDRLPARIQEVI
jgi:hypothetical protein